MREGKLDKPKANVAGKLSSILDPNELPDSVFMSAAADGSDKPVKERRKSIAKTFKDNCTKKNRKHTNSISDQVELSIPNQVCDSTSRDMNTESADLSNTREDMNNQRRHKYRKQTSLAKRGEKESFRHQILPGP